jgi:hypothetical protein
MKMIFLEGHPLKTNGDVETALKWWNRTLTLLTKHKNSFIDVISV